MKTTFRFIIAAMAAGAVLASCQKEMANETANNATCGIRVISAKFDNSTKASLDGFTPKFEVGDKIRVSNGKQSQECEIYFDGSGDAKFMITNLDGPDYTAIYPASAAVLTGGDGSPIADPGFKVSASQDGSIAKALIAKASLTEKTPEFIFKVQTALFAITPPKGAKKITIKSLKPIVGGVARTGEAVAINTEGADAANKNVITVDVPSDGTAYVALVPGVNLTDLSFEYSTDNSHGEMKGIPANDITTAGKTDKTAANTKYTIGSNNWHPYVIINGKKWATTNIGASEPAEAGKYFAWGEVTGRIPSGSTFSPIFYWGNDGSCPFFEKAHGDDYGKIISVEFKKYNDDDNKTVLDLKDDAANVNWGGSWRMPTEAEFAELVANKEWDSTNKGYKFGTSLNEIFLPAAGYGDSRPEMKYYTGKDLHSVGDSGGYWSSSLGSSYYQEAQDIFILEESSSVSSQYRYVGFSIRAISDL